MKRFTSSNCRRFCSCESTQDQQRSTGFNEQPCAAQKLLNYKNPRKYASCSAPRGHGFCISIHPLIISDHMEAGMMAVYTIYEPQHCTSPVQFVSTDFWRTPGKFEITVKNTGREPMRDLSVTFDHLMTPPFRRHPYDNEGDWNALIPPRQEKSFEMTGYLPAYTDSILAWPVSQERHLCGRHQVAALQGRQVF